MLNWLRDLMIPEAVIIRPEPPPPPPPVWINGNRCFVGQPYLEEIYHTLQNEGFLEGLDGNTIITVIRGCEPALASGPEYALLFAIIDIMNRR